MPYTDHTKLKENNPGSEDEPDNFVATAKKEFERDKEGWSDIYEAGNEDLNFLSDKEDAQWNPKDYNDRVKSGRPALTLDKLGQFTRQVSNQIRMNTPSINIIPSGNDSDPETAEKIKGLVRNIEYKSDADSAYDTASLASIRSSIGFIRVDHDYVDEDSFEQELIINRVVNNFSCWIDRDSVEVDGCDAKRGWCAEKILVSKFREQWPDLEPVGFDAGDPIGTKITDNSEITIVECFKIEEQEAEIAVYGDDNEVVPYDENREEEPTLRRKVKKRIVKRYKLSGADILEETTFPGKYIPIVPVYGEEFWQNGTRHLFSLVRKAKTAQQMHNYMKSLETEILQKQPQAPYIAGEGQVEDYVDDWTNPGKTAVLRYKTHDAEGNPLPPPQRVNPPVTPSGVFNASAASVDDIKAAMGMYSASIGQQGNEVSGIAIQRRKQEGEIGTYHFADNLTKSVTHVGRILVSAIPEIYDTGRVIRVVGEEDEVEMVGVNGKPIEGQERDYDLTKGKYDVRVTTGLSFTTMRQESAEFFSQIVSQQPQLMGIVGDLVFKYMDIPGAQALSERLKRSIPPEILGDEDEGEDQDPEKMQMAQIIEQGQQALNEMQQQLAQSEEALKDKEAELTIKAQSENNKAENDRAKLELEVMKLEVDQQKDALDAANNQQELALKVEELRLKELEIIGRLEQGQDKIRADERKQIVSELNKQPTEIATEEQSLANEGNVFEGENL